MTERSCRGALLACAAAWLWGAASPLVAAERGTVRYLHRDRVYLSVGSAAGMTAGSVVELSRGGKRTARVRLEQVSAHHSAGVLLGREGGPRAGDDVQVPARMGPTRAKATPRPARPLPRPALATTWQRAPAPRFEPRRPRRETAPPPRTRAQAFLRSTGWVWLSRVPEPITHRDRLTLRLDAALDPADRWHVSADGDLVGQVSRGADPATQPVVTAWAEVYQAALLARLPAGLELGVGRQPTYGLRYGLVDGAFFRWWLPGGAVLRVSAGTRPHSVRLVPWWWTPAMTASLDGVLAWGWGSAAYQGALGWLAANALSGEATEAAGRFTLELGRVLWLDADAAVVGWNQGAGKLPGASLDRLMVSGLIRQGPLTVTAAARRLGGGAWGTEASRMPPFSLSAEPFYDASFNADVTRLSAWSAGAGLTGGAVWDDSHRADRFYLSPDLHVRLAPWWHLRGRVAYRCELGPTGAQLMDLALAAEPWPGFHVSTWQQGGVWMVSQTREFLPSYSFNLAAEYRWLGLLSVGLRGRGMLGAAGNGVEATAWLGARDGA